MKLKNSFKLAPLASLAAIGTLGLGFTPAQAAIVTSGCASETSCTLAELLDGGGIQVGDKLFSEWFIQEASDGFDPAQVTITGLDDDPLNPGLSYDFSNQIVGDQTTEGGLGVFFGFSVDVLDPSFRVKHSSLSLTDGEVTGSGGVVAFSSITDLLGNTLIDTALIVGKVPEEEILFSEAEFDPQSSIGVTTAATGGINAEEEGTFSLKSFEQRFSQTSAVPEGSTSLSVLFGAGAVVGGSTLSGWLKSKRKNLK
jgi:hypothetical protein